MIDRLLPIRATVEDGPVSSFQTLVGGQLLRDQHQVSYKWTIFWLQVIKGRNRAARNDEQVHRSLWINVAEGNTLVVLINDISWNISINDTFE